MAPTHRGNRRTEGSHIEVLEEIDWEEMFKEPDDPGETLMEIAERLGKNKKSLVYQLDKKISEGLLIKGRAVREDAAGRRVVHNVYRPKD